MIVIHHPGPPQGKGRPRRGANGVMYTPQKTRDYEQALRLRGIAAMAGREKLAGPVVVAVLAVFPIPPSWPLKNQEQARRGIVRPTGRPDADNVLKAVDALNGVVWADDSSIVEAHVKKIYGAKPGLTIRVWRTDEAVDADTVPAAPVRGAA